MIITSALKKQRLFFFNLYRVHSRVSLSLQQYE